jgi:hypothetical protein
LRVVYRKESASSCVLWILWIVRMEVMDRPMHGSSPHHQPPPATPTISLGRTTQHKGHTAQMPVNLMLHKRASKTTPCPLGILTSADLRYGATIRLRPRDEHPSSVTPTPPRSTKFTHSLHN